MKCDELKSFIVRYNGEFISAYKETEVEPDSLEDTDGCILIGNTADLTLLKIGYSIPAVAQLVKAMDKSATYSLFVRNEI